jgi:hypothetical protein
MKLLPLLSAAALLAGCAGVPEQEEERPSQIAKDPAKIHGFFLRKIRAGLPGVAAAVTTLGPEELTIGVNNTIAPDLTRRILLGFEQHSVVVAPDGMTATARWCNPEFGLSNEFHLRAEKLAGRILWKLVVTREQIEDFARAGIAWFRKQREAADGRIYAYPPDWVAANVSNRCGCPPSP